MKSLKTNFAGLSLSLALMYSPSQAQCFRQIGSSPNVYTSSESSTSQVIVNNDLNTIMFIHRNNNTLFGGDNGAYRYDISTDNGNTWQTNLGPLNVSSQIGVNGGRYPQAGIYNPAGNTDISNATLVYHGSTFGNFWNGYVSGSLLLDGTSTPSENYNQSGAVNTEIARGFCQSVPGVYWLLDRNGNQGIRLFKGVLDGSDVNWSVYTEFPLDPSFTGFADYSMAFDPGGQHGWIVTLVQKYDDSTYQPVVYETHDGGTTWNGPTSLALSSFGNLYPSQPAPTCGFEVDIAVDMNGHPHIQVGIYPSIFSAEWDGDGIMCDITYNGTDWSAVEMSRYIYQSSFIYLSDNRPQICSSDDGSKLVYVWSETDYFGNGEIKAVTYDVVTGTLSCPYNYSVVCPSSGNGLYYQVSVASNMLESNGLFTVPMVLTLIEDPNNDTGPANHFYLDGFTFSSAEFTTIASTVTPRITPDGPTEFCEGASVNLIADAQSSYLWNTGETTQSITASGGNYWVINPDINTCLSGENFISINAIPAPGIVVYTYPAQICPGQSLELFASYSSAGNTFLWNTGETTSSIVVTEGGSYVVAVDGCESYPGEIFQYDFPVNDNICSATTLAIGAVTHFNNGCASVEQGEPVPPVVDFGFGNQNGWLPEYSPDELPFLNNTVWFTFTAPSSGAVNIKSSFDDYPNDTQLALYESDNDSCNGNMILIAANDDSGLPFLEFSSEINRAYCLKRNKKYFVQVDGYGGQVGPGTIEIIAVPNTVTVCHTLPNGNSVSLAVSGCALATHLANGDVIGECNTVRISGTEFEDESFVAFPNPSDGIVHVSFTSANKGAYKYELLDITGRSLFVNTGNASPGENTNVFDMTDFAPGVYFLKFTKDNSVYQKRIVLQ